MRAHAARDRISPLVRRLGADNPQRQARDEMALEVEGVVDDGVHAEKTLGGTSRLEPLHLALSSSHCLMRVFRPVVFAQPLLMRAVQSQTPERAGVGRSVSVTSNLDAKPCFLSSLRISRSVARVSRRR